jgi:outer membrane protein TolC
MKIFKYIKIVLIVYILLSVSNLLADNNSPVKPIKVSEVLSLNRFVELACEHDVKFQEILIERLKLQYQYGKNMPSADLVLALKSQYNFALQDDGNSGNESVVSLSKLFPYTGTEISASYATSPNKIGTDNSSTFTTMISQPIAQNAFGRANRMLKKVTELDVAIQKFQIIEAYEDYLASLLAIYYQWYSDYANFKNAQVTYNDNYQLLQNIRKRKRSRIADQSDVDKIHLQVIEMKEKVLTMKSTYENSLQLIYQVVSYAGKTVLVPEFVKYYEEAINYETEHKLFNQNSRTSEILSLIEKKGVVSLKREADGLLPSLNLLFGYTKEGSGYKMEEKQDNLFAGFSFEFSFWQQQKKANYEISKIKEQKVKLSHKGVRLRLKTDLKNLYKKIKLEHELLKTAENKIAIGKRIYFTELKNYRQARSALNDVIQAINNLEKYKFDKVQHKIKLETYLVEWLRLNDRLIKKIK